MQSDQFQLHAEIEERHWWFVGRRRIMRRLAQAMVPPSKDSLAIDIGCGTGANIASLADMYQCVGIDTSAEAIALARNRYPHVDFRVGRAPDDLGDVLPRADLVLLMDVLEHVPDDFALFSSILGAARPGAKFLLTVPADQELWSRHDESFGHYRRYDAERFAKLWQGLPVQADLISYYNTRLYPLVKLIRRRNRRRATSAGEHGTDFKMPGRLANLLLKKTFAGEMTRLERLLADKAAEPYRHGVSLIAVLTRGEGPIATRPRPRGVVADYFDPVAALPACSVLA